ncbi:DUF3987 domain-containing protein, partial [Streptomyces thioluteus]|uniref:DUF3987 domain-containing protein n=1 Tax=Streptomyces thioluteus TaxID=66431 RepID=UPI0031F15071
MMRETSGITSGAALVDHLHEQMEITQEASGVPDTRALIIEQEWKETLETVARDRSYGPKIRQAWDCETLRNNTTRKGPNHQPKVVPNPRVVFHTHITPEDWQTMVSLKEAAGGSYNRFLPVALSDVPLLRRRTVPLVNTGDLVRAYKWVREADRVMTFTSAADHIYWVMRRAEKVLIKSLPKNQSVYVSRSAEQTWRVAALLACSEGSSRIAVGHMEAAASFVKYSIDTVLNLTKELSGTGRP